MCPALTWIRSDRLAVAQRAVANRALGWRLRVELGDAQSLRSNCSKRNTIDAVGQSPLPDVVPNLNRLSWRASAAAGPLPARL
jgi:hypothetical protein